MVVGIKDTAKLIGIAIMVCCAVFVCTLFLNFNMDIVDIKDKINSEQAMFFYEAQVSSAKLVSMISGGCLLVTSIIMLLFYIKHYIDTHKKELGILKALGHSNLKTASNFWTFAISVLIGSSIGFGGAFIFMPIFYNLQNEDNILPEIMMTFHPILLIFLVVVPTLAFAALAVFYAFFKLKKPVLYLLKDNYQLNIKVKKYKKEKKADGSFTDDLKRSTLKSKKTLVFFIAFASFCFSAMTQMSFGIVELSSEMMGIIVMAIGLVLAFTTLFLAITTVIHGNTKTIAMMRVFGYSQKLCSRSLLGGYRPIAYIGFAIGTLYQYFLIKLVVDIVFGNIETAGNLTYDFDFVLMLISLAVFIALYETIMYFYSERIKKISIKEIMTE